MTQIDFYIHAENKLQLACQLCAKAYERNLKVVIYTPDRATTEQLDRLLWTAGAIGFIPHCRASHPLAGETPVILDHSFTEIPYDDVLVNLHSELPGFFSRFQRLIEIVSLDDTDRQQARERFRFYRDRGYEIRSHDLSARF
jgi:DNA polymerase III subunit chi